MLRLNIQLNDKIRRMVNIIHKNMYSNRLKTIEEFEPYEYDIQGQFMINSFMMFLCKFLDEDFLLESIEDFCETKRKYISEVIKSRILKNSYYDRDFMAKDLETLLTKYQTSDILDFLDICINNIENEIQNLNKKYGDHSTYLRNKDPNNVYDLARLKNSFIDSLNEVFEYNNLGYQFVDGVIATKKSDFLHIEAICKPVTLLISEEFKGPLEEFKTAIENYRKKDYGNTIIQACKAFESTMKAILGKLEIEFDRERSTSNTLVKLLQEKGLFDIYLSDSLNKVTNILTSGLPTVRNKEAAHGSGIDVKNITRSYASYALNCAGTYIVFLIDRYYDIKK